MVLNTSLQKMATMFGPPRLTVGRPAQVRAGLREDEDAGPPTKTAPTKTAQTTTPPSSSRGSAPDRTGSVRVVLARQAPASAASAASSEAAPPSRRVVVSRGGPAEDDLPVLPPLKTDDAPDDAPPLPSKSPLSAPSSPYRSPFASPAADTTPARQPRLYSSRSNLCPRPSPTAPRLGSRLVRAGADVRHRGADASAGGRGKTALAARAARARARAPGRRRRLRGQFGRRRAGRDAREGALVDRLVSSRTRVSWKTPLPAARRRDARRPRRRARRDRRARRGRRPRAPEPVEFGQLLGRFGG